MSKQIHQYTAANSIDASADYLLIDPASSGIYKSINRNTLLALASAPLGLSDSQSPQNKVFDNTNSLTVKDGSLTIQNTASTTKQAVFSASGITAGQTRTFTFPDASGTLATIAGTQTLTNKTITSPTITGGTIDNSTITVDSIAGHTVATTVTVGNVQMANGVINTSGAVTSTAIAIGAVQPQALVTGTGTGWAFQSYTPGFTNLTVGNGTLLAGYNQTGKLVNVRLSLVFGSTTSISGSVGFTLPVASIATYRTDSIIGTSIYNGGNYGPGFVVWGNTTNATLQVINATGTYAAGVNLSSTIPFTWAAGSVITAMTTYEAA